MVIQVNKSEEYKQGQNQKYTTELTGEYIMFPIYWMKKLIMNRGYWT